MTLAGAYVNISSEGTPIASVFADSRITLESGHVDGYPKLLDLGGELAIAFSGSSLPVVAAAELARSLIEMTSWVRAREQPARTVGLWLGTRIFSYHLLHFYEQLRRHEKSSHVLVAGLISRGTPGIAEINLNPHREPSVRFFRGDRGHVGLAIGHPEYTPLLSDVLRVLPEYGPTGGMHVLASCLAYVINHQGEATQTIGGGLGIGYLIQRGRQPFWGWPPLRCIDGRHFSRGFNISGIADQMQESGWVDLEDRHAEVEKIDRSLVAGSQANAWVNPAFEVGLEKWLAVDGGPVQEPELPSGLL